jgi:hypothetical protein
MRRDGARIGRQIEDAAQPGDNERQRGKLRKTNRYGKRVTVGRPHGNGALVAADIDGA